MAARQPAVLDLVFMGTPDFAVPIVAALAAAGHRILAVYTQPPRPAGRGHRLMPSPVQAWAEKAGIPVHTPRTLRDPAAQAVFAGHKADAAVVAAYGLILPQPVLDAPRLGCINVHASLLPRWRGAAPIQRAIQAGDRESGVTIMQMEAGLDTGPMLLTGRVPITGETTGGSLHDALAALGAALIVPALAGLNDGTLAPQPQPEAGVTYARKLERAEGRIDWSRPAAELERTARAFDPWPGTWFEHGGETIKLLRAAVVDAGSGPPGTVLDAAPTVACGEGALRLLRLQRPGRAPMPAGDLLRGFPLPPGTVLG